MGNSSAFETLKDQGCTLAESGNFDAACEAFSRAISLFDGDAYAHEMFAQCLMETNRSEEAYIAARTATQLQSEWSGGYLTLARAARNVGALQDAVQALQQCLALDPDDVDDVAAELSEVTGLLEEQIGRQVGLPHLRIHQHIGGEEGPGGVVWECGLMLAAYLQQNCAGLLRGQRVLELGSGTGIVGLTAACLGAHVTLTDVAPLLPLLDTNIARNSAAISSAGGSVSRAALHWESFSDAPVAHGQYDLVLGADLVYRSGAVLQYLADVLRQVVHGRPECGVLMCHKSRHSDVDERLFEYMRGIGLRLQLVATFADNAAVKLYHHSGA